MNITPLHFTAHVESLEGGTSALDSPPVAYVQASGNIEPGMMPKNTHSVPGVVMEWISPSDSMPFFNLARSDATFGHVPCEIVVHEDTNNLNLFTAKVACGGSVASRGVNLPWCERLRTLVHVVSSIETGVIHMDFPQSVEYDNAMCALSEHTQSIVDAISGKNIVVLVSKKLSSMYVGIRRGTGMAGTGIPILTHVPAKADVLANQFALFSTLYDTTLAEAFAHVAGYCMVSKSVSQHFLMALPDCVVPVRFNIGRSEHSVCARASGSIVNSSLNYGTSNGGFLFDAHVGKWSISFFAVLTEMPPSTTIIPIVSSTHSNRVNTCMELIRAQNDGAAGSAFFKLVSMPRLADDRFEDLVSVLLRAVERRYGVSYTPTSGFPRPPLANGACRQASMGVIAEDEPFL